MNFRGRFEETELRPEPGHAGHQHGYSRFRLVDTAVGSVHIGSGICQLAPAGTLDLHAHSFEEAFYLLQGQVTLSVGGEARRLGPDDYGFIPIGAEHRWQNDAAQPARWLEVFTPQPKPGAEGTHTVLLKEGWAASAPALLELRDPRPLYVGHLDEAHTPPAEFGTELPPTQRRHGLRVASLVDQRAGAENLFLIMPQLLPGGRVHAHDHPIEEMYFFLRGEIELELDGVRHRMKPGDFGWSGVGCVHSFANLGTVPARWLEAQAPQPLTKSSIRYRQDWEDVQRQLGKA